MDLFAHSGVALEGHPLADQLRPRSLEEFVGQQKVIGKDSFLGRMLTSGTLPSLILWGPPGTGKTTLARLMADHIHAEFVSRNAIDTGAKALRDLAVEAHRRRIEQQMRTVLFVDEIHRLNKGQQDVLLPSLENGDLILVGATTENPSYELNPALLSRCRLIVFQKLEPQDLRRLLERGFQALNMDLVNVLSEQAQDALLNYAGGDGRRLLNAVEQLAGLKTQASGEDTSWSWPLSAEQLSEAVGSRALYYDRDRDEHHDTISAFIKSIRGSDPDAGLYYLARMLEGGEDPLFIARRLVILASEDVGNADPRALSLAVAGVQAIELVGLPEGAINLAQVVTYLACAPKSNRIYLGLRQAQEEVKRSGNLPIPLALRSARTAAMKRIGYGEGYNYAHEGERGWMEQQFLPDAIAEKHFYELSGRGFEKTMEQYLDWLKGRK